MIEEDIDDTHLCIKCSETIVGLENYVEHRKSNCGNKTSRVTTEISNPYGPFEYSGTPSFIKSVDGGKTPKSPSDAYDLHYDLGADLFFSSLELQSSSKRSAIVSTSSPSIGNKPSSSRMLTRRAAAALGSNHEPDDEWIAASHSNNSESLMKAVRDISGNKKCDSIFKQLPFNTESPEQSENEDIDVEDDFTSGGKWKSDNCTGNRPMYLRSPMWDCRPLWDMSVAVEEDLNPPPSHTRGKWVPGTKSNKLTYKDDAFCENVLTQHWCTTCQRGLASKLLYEKHLKSALHLKRRAPEQQLERICLNVGNLSRHYSQIIERPPENINRSTQLLMSKKRQRFKAFIRCETCRTRVQKQVLGKHLISHYHYRRMTLNPLKSFDLILENIHRIVLQSPFQCKTCKFYANTEEYFLMHWRSPEHLDNTKGSTKFWCALCKFECDDNDDMENHLLSSEHKEVIIVINRSFPIVISKRTAIICSVCNTKFQYNIELRKHTVRCAQNCVSTASDDYQSRHICKMCGEICKSKLSLQRHNKFRHGVKRFFCTICNMEFSTRAEASKHRNSSLHKNTTDAIKKKTKSYRKCYHCEIMLPNLLELKKHIDEQHPNSKHICLQCGVKFTLPQDLGRHVRDRICQPSTSIASTQVENSHLPLANRKSAVKIPDNAVLIAVGCDDGELPLELENLPEKPKIEDTHVDVLHCCLQCNFKSNIEAELIFHEMHHSSKEPINVTKKIPCPLCKKEFRKHSLRFHLRQHTNEKLFDCKLCEMKFSRKQNLKTHVENIHEKKNLNKAKMQNSETESVLHAQPSQTEIACEICGKMINRSYLKRHISTHTARDMKYSCPVETCFYRGQFYSDLCTHMESQHKVTEVKRFLCGIGQCDYRGKSKALLTRHRAMMHKPSTQKYKCTDCSFHTRISGHLKRHMRSHTGEKPFKCPHCDYVCSTSEYLRKHVVSTKQHPGKYLYECDHCDQNKPKDIFKTNFQRDYHSHLVSSHSKEHFKI